MRAQTFDATKKTFDGMLVPEVKAVPNPKEPEKLTFADDQFFTAPERFLMDTAFDEEKRMLPAPSFDPAIDDIEEQEFMDMNVARDVLEAAESDKKRLQLLGNPMTAEDQIDYLMQPQREGQEVKRQREEFNGFLHWGLLHAANTALDQDQDPKKAHQFINRYMRDIDLFTQWLKHPRVIKHFQKKFNIDVSQRYNKLLGMTMAMYLRSRVQCHEGDYSGALKSLVAGAGMLNDSGDLKDERQRKALGAILSARGMVYLKLRSPERAEHDLTKSMQYLPMNRCATLFQLRADAREQLGKIDEAREDEERAADIWEKGEVLSPGLDSPQVKWVL